MKGAPSADHSVDYYEDLQISPHADTETIERVYRMLAKRYHPDSRSTGNVERFDRVTKAYHVLADPVRRAAYDVAYDQVRDRRWNLATASAPASTGNGKDLEIRNAVLSILYIERRNDPTGASVGLYQLEKLLGWPEKMLEFHVWYLKEKGWIQRTDSGGYAITAKGIDVLEQSGITTGKDRLLPGPKMPEECVPEEHEAVIDPKEIASDGGTRRCSRVHAYPTAGVLPAGGIR